VVKGTRLRQRGDEKIAQSAFPSTPRRSRRSAAALGCTAKRASTDPPRPCQRSVMRASAWLPSIRA
jgi:hypothetical protein